MQTLGRRYDTIYKVTLGFGIATAGVATYLWIRDLTRKKSASTDSGSTARWIVPTVGEGFAGAAAGGTL